jgi:hypothetical protein
MLAKTASTLHEPPLPLRIRAVDLLGKRIEEFVPDMPIDKFSKLWVDPMCRWILFVDGLDEVDEQAQQEVL